MKSLREISKAPLWPVFIPSKGRADTAKVWPELDPTIVVEPHDEEAYREAFPDRKLLVMPENDQGICYVRDFIRCHNKSWFWVLDDDVSKFGITQLKKNREMPAGQVLRFAQHQAAEACLDAIGLNYQQLAWAAARPLKIPDSIEVCGAFNGELLQNVGYNYQVPGKEDKAYCIELCMMGFRVGRALKMWFATEPLGKKPGGLHQFYAEKRDSGSAELMAKKYPGIVTTVAKEGRTDIRINWKAIK